MKNIAQENASLVQQLGEVEKLAVASRWGRFVYQPGKYIYAIGLKDFIYPLSKQTVKKHTRLFTGAVFTLLLPAATDIYLTGGKSHPSEIKLARFFITHLKPMDIVWDIGAHYGYFSLLAAQLVGKSGEVYALEASHEAFKILSENSAAYPQISTINKVASESSGQVLFYELPNLYSEYSSTDLSQFQNADWFSDIHVTKRRLDAISLDGLAEINGKTPHLIKMDIEGGEAAAIKGSKEILSLDPDESPFIIMEYLEPGRKNQAHREADEQLRNYGFQAHRIRKDGSISQLNDIEKHLKDSGLESDNIVYVK